MKKYCGQETPDSFIPDTSQRKIYHVSIPLTDGPKTYAIRAYSKREALAIVSEHVQIEQGPRWTVREAK